ncbi:MAG: hypothetical protein M3294_06030 [Pseudomonadota bacterium]|nr:hypothetical protein [Pseudomonadota bacterium]
MTHVVIRLVLALYELIVANIITPAQRARMGFDEANGLRKCPEAALDL